MQLQPLNSKCGLHSDRGQTGQMDCNTAALNLYNVHTKHSAGLCSSPKALALKGKSACYKDMSRADKDISVIHARI